MTTLPAGWKLVPIEPTREMWVAVNKLDDEMAAGSYDGKGASIEQVWNCLVDAAPTPPASAQPERDWELTCDHCNGAGHVFVERQVAERKSDVQEFKEECGCCNGRGFTIAFEDIPGIDEYVRKSRPVASAQDDAKDSVIAGALFDFMGFLTTLDQPVTLGASKEATIAVKLLEQWAERRGLHLSEAAVTGWNRRRVSAADDAQDAQRYLAWRDAMLAEDTEFKQAVAAALPSDVGDKRPPTSAEWDAAIDAALAASQQQEG